MQNERHPFAVWGNLGFGIDGRTRSGFHFRVFIGVEQMLDCQDDPSHSCSSFKPEERRIPYLGAGLGYAPSFKEG